MAHHLTGRALWGGTARGPVYRLVTPTADRQAPMVTDREAEIQRLRTAYEETLAEFKALEREMGRQGDHWLHFRAYHTALDEEALWVEAAALVDREGCDGATGLLLALERLQQLLGGALDDIERDRLLYLTAAGQWLYRRLIGLPGPLLAGVPAGCLVAAADLAPADLLLAQPGQVLGILLEAAEPWVEVGENPAGIPVVAGIANLLELADGEGEAQIADDQVWLGLEAGEPPKSSPPAPLHCADGATLAVWSAADGPRLKTWPDLVQVERLPGEEPVLIDLDGLGDPCHPGAVWLLHRAVIAAHAGGRTVGLAGEPAGVPALLPLWLALGIDALLLPDGASEKLRQTASELSATVWVCALPLLLEENSAVGLRARLVERKISLHAV